MASPQFLQFAFTGVEAVCFLGVFGLGKLYLWSKSNDKITDTLEKCNEVLVKVDQLQQLSTKVDQLQNLSTKVDQLQNLSTKVETLEGLVKKGIIQNDSIISGNKGLAKILKQGLNENAGSNLNAISVMKVVVVGAIGYGVWKWTGCSVSGIVNGTKRSVAGVLSSMTKNVEKKSAAISEKMRNLSEKLENCGKPDEPKATQNLKKKVAEVGRDVSQSDNVLDLNKKIYNMIPLEGTKCKLYRMDEEDIVAEAIWATDDPTALVNGCKIGRNACKVWVTNAIEPNAKVWRPVFGIQIMEEATKSFIAWPADHIIYAADYDREAGGSVSEIMA